MRVYSMTRIKNIVGGDMQGEGSTDRPWLLLPHALDDGCQDFIGLYSQHIGIL